MRETQDRSQCLLLVDDDEDIRLLLTDQLRSMGYEVCQATNGREALDIISRRRIDGMLVDVRMPVMDGWTMLEQLQERHALFPIIVMSADDPGKIAPTAREHGAQGYLPKPFSLSHVRDTCVRVFGALPSIRLAHDSLT